MTTTVKPNGHYTMADHMPCPCGASIPAFTPGDPIYTPTLGWRRYCVGCSRVLHGVPSNTRGREHRDSCTMVPTQQGVGTGNYACPCGAYTKWSESR
jgi:hypothetical protein